MASSSHLLRGERGNILVVSLLLLLTMSLMGVGLLYSVGKETKMVAMTVRGAETFHAAETCVEDAVRWLKEQTSKGLPKVPHTISESNLDHLVASGEDQEIREKLNDYSYECLVEFLTEANAIGVGTGAGVGLATRYGAGSQIKKYYYKIISSGYGPKNTKTDIEVVASLLR